MGQNHKSSQRFAAAAAVACALAAVGAAAASGAGGASPSTVAQWAPAFLALTGQGGGYVVATPYGEARLVEGGAAFLIHGGRAVATVEVRFVGGEGAVPQVPAGEGPAATTALVYKALQPGIDLVYRATSSGVKYEYRLVAGVPASRILVRVAGAETLTIDADGTLRMGTAAGELRDSPPASFQGERPVACRFALSDARTYGFSCDGVDPSRPLTIDPLVYSTLVGGSSYNYEYPFAIGADGSMVLTGATYSADFPTTLGAFDNTSNGDWDVTLTKLNAQGSSLVFSTYLGGSSYDKAMGMALDAAGNIYVVGTTYSSDFPVTNGSFDTSFNGYYWYYGDAFVAKFNATGALVWCTYLGGSADDAAFAVAVDGVGAVYVFGVTNSLNLPSTNQAWDGSADGGFDTFVAKLAPNGSSLDYITYLGGAADDRPGRIAVDGAGNAVVVGTTASSDFPVTGGAFDTAYGGGEDAFAVRINATAGSLLYSTLIGGRGDEEATGLVLNADGSAAVGGWTSSSDFPTTGGAFDRSVAAVDAFALRLDAGGDALEFSTVVGGNGNDYATDLKLDALGEVYLTGYTSSSVDFPTTASADDRTFDGGTYDAFLVRLSGNASKLLFATYLGGAYDDYAYSVAVASPFVAYVAGYTASGNFPTTSSAYNRTFGGYVMSFISGIKSAYRAHYETWPAGLNVSVDAQVLATPADVPCWVGSLRMVSVPTVQVAATDRYTFAFWNHSVSQSHVLSCTGDGSFVATFTTEVLLTFDSNTPGALVRIDDRSYFTPYSKWCAQGSNASLNVSTPQVVNGSRFTFLGWSDGGARSHLTSCSAPKVAWANFSTEYLFSLDSLPSGLEVDLDGSNQTAPFSTWCAAGSVHTLETPALQEVARTRFGFLSWSDGGPRVRTLPCAAPVNLTAAFSPVSHLVSVATDPAGLRVTVEGGEVVTPYSFWCVHGATARLGVPADQERAGVRFAFRAWSFNASGAPDQPVACEGPLDVTAALVAKAYLVGLSTSPSALQLQLGPTVLDTPAQYWCTVGSSFIVGAPSPQTRLDTREVFANWSDARPASHAVACAGPTELDARFTTQYRVDLRTTPAGLEAQVGGAVLPDGGSAWCDAGSTFAAAAGTVERGASTRFVFESWSDGAGAAREVTCDAPRTLTPSFSTEYRAEIATLPPGLKVRVDNDTAAAPITRWWQAGSSHEVEFPTPQNFADQSFSFENWSDGGLARHAVRADGPLEITASAAGGGLPDFRLFLPSFEMLVQAGAAATVELRVESLNNYSAPDLTVTAADLPDGVEVRCTPQRLPPGTACTLEVRVAPAVPAGDYAFTLRADNGTQVHVRSVTLHVPSQRSFTTNSEGGSALPLAAGLAVMGAALAAFLVLMRRRRRDARARAERRGKPDGGPPQADPWVDTSGTKRP